MTSDVTESSTTSLMETRVKRFIENDDVVALEQFFNDFRLELSHSLFDFCSEHLAVNCFMFLYNSRSEETISRDNRFFKFCSDQASKGLNYDDRPLWTNSHKRNAQNPPPPQYKIPWGHSVPESVFYNALIAGVMRNDTQRATSFVRMLMMSNIPIGDNLYFSVNSDHRIQSYVSMLHKYLYQDHFNTYRAKKKKNSRSSY